MCLATLGKIKKIKPNNMAEVEFDGVRYEVNVELIEAKVNDYIMVHAGYAIQKVRKKDVREFKKLTS